MSMAGMNQPGAPTMEAPRLQPPVADGALPLGAQPGQRFSWHQAGTGAMNFGRDAVLATGATLPGYGERVIDLMVWYGTGRLGYQAYGIKGAVAGAGVGAAFTEMPARQPVGANFVLPYRSNFMNAARSVGMLLGTAAFVGDVMGMLGFKGAQFMEKLF